MNAVTHPRTAVVPAVTAARVGSATASPAPARSLPDRARAILPGLALAVAVAAVATVVGQHVPLVGSAVPGAVIGAIIALIIKPGTRLAPGIKYASTFLLQCSVVLLGTQLSIAEAARVGVASLPVMLGTLAVCLSAAWLYGRLLGIPRDQGRRLGYVETISVLKEPPAALGWGDDTIVFFNDSDRFTYRDPADQVDTRSGIICFPNNFEYGPGRGLPEGFFRVTCLANFESWAGLPEERYQADKALRFGQVQESAKRFLPRLNPPGALETATVTTDMFTPTTVVRYTGHLRGAIYGDPVKHPDGRTSLSNLFLCGTDQGMLGIVGAMLSGISMANEHVLKAQAAPA